MIQNKIRLLLFVAAAFSMDFVDAGRGTVDSSPALKPSAFRKKSKKVVNHNSDSESQGLSSGYASDVEGEGNVNQRGLVDRTPILKKFKGLKKTNIDLEAAREKRVKAAEDAYREEQEQEQEQAAYEEENAAKKARIARIAKGRSALSGR